MRRQPPEQNSSLSRRSFLGLGGAFALTTALPASVFAQEAIYNDYIGPISVKKKDPALPANSEYPDIQLEGAPGNIAFLWIPVEGENVFAYGKPDSEKDPDNKYTGFIFPDDRGDFFLPEGTWATDVSGNTVNLPSVQKITPPQYNIIVNHETGAIGEPRFDVIHVLPGLDRTTNSRHGTNDRSGFIFLDSFSLAQTKDGRPLDSIASVMPYDDRSDFSLMSGRMLNDIRKAYSNRDAQSDWGATTQAMYNTLIDHIKYHGAEPWMYQHGLAVLKRIHLRQNESNPYTTLSEYEEVHEYIGSEWQKFLSDHDKASPNAKEAAAQKIQDIYREAKRYFERVDQSPIPAPGF